MRGLWVCLVGMLCAVACGDDETTTPAAGSGASSGVGASGSGASGSGATGGAGGAGTGGTGAGTQGGQGPGFSLRFFGNGGLDDDRVKIRIDDPMNSLPGPPVDVGATDFTIEFWMKANASDNPNPALSCGNDNSWVGSNIIIDRDRHNQPLSFGIGIAGGVLVFAVNGEFGDRTLCGQTMVLDDGWHHVAMVRRISDGFMWILLDGEVDASDDGPDGDISYPDDGVPLNVCPGGLCDYSDPFLVFGAEKHGYSDISYNGLLDEVRISTSLRYTGSYSVPGGPFATDGDTVGLYHFDEGQGSSAADSSGAPGGPSDGTLNVGGTPEGPQWTADHPF